MAVFCQGGTHIAATCSAGGWSLGKVTNNHIPLQCCQQSLISLCLHSLSGPQRKVVTSPVVFWIALLPRAAQSTATAGIQQLWLLIWTFGFVRTSPEEWLMSVSRIRDVDEWTALPYLNCFWLSVFVPENQSNVRISGRMSPHLHHFIKRTAYIFLLLQMKQGASSKLPVIQGRPLHCGSQHPCDNR